MHPLHASCICQGTLGQICAIAGKAQQAGIHSLVSVVDIQLVLQHLFPLKSEADVSAAIQAVSSDRQITISALMPTHR